MGTVLKVVAILVALGSGLVGVLGETRDKATNRLKALGWCSIGFMLLGGLVALVIAREEYAESLARRQRESEMEKVARSILSAGLPVHNIKIHAEFQNGAGLPQDWDESVFGMMCWTMRDRRQSEMRFSLTRSKGRFRSTAQVEGESQRASVPLFVSDCLDDGSACWIRVPKADVVRDFLDPRVREGLFVFWPYDKFSDFYGTELNVALTGGYAPKVARLEIIFNDLYGIPVSLSPDHVLAIPAVINGKLVVGVKGREGQVKDLFGAIVAAIVVANETPR
jgi:hypothetical protein